VKHRLLLHTIYYTYFPIFTNSGAADFFIVHSSFQATVPYRTIPYCTVDSGLKHESTKSIVLYDENSEFLNLVAMPLGEGL
jgi:hypothetical protein